MLTLTLAVVSAIIGAILVPPRARFGYAVASALVFLCLGEAIPQTTAVDAMNAAVVTAALPPLTAARRLYVGGPLWSYAIVVLVGGSVAVLDGGLNMFETYAMALGLGLAILANSMSAREWVAVWTVIIAISLIVAALLVIESFVIRNVLFATKPFGVNPFVSSTIRAQATLGHPLVASFTCVIGTFGALRSPMRLPLKLLFTVVLFAGTLATGSSTTVIATVIGFGGWFLIGRRARLSVFRLVVLAALIVGMAALSLSPTAIIDDVSGNQSQHRLNSLMAIPSLLNDRGVSGAIFGSGFGSAEMLYQKGIFNDDGFFAIDNQFVSVLAATGILGFGFFLMFILMVLWRARGLDRVLLISLLLVFLGFDVLLSPSAGPLFMVFAASVISAGGRTKPAKSERAALLDRVTVG